MDRQAALKTTILTICALTLGACGRVSSTEHIPSTNATTGYFDAEGIDYTDGGDPRVGEALKTEAPPTPGKSTLAHVLKEFEISRFDKGSETPSQKGNDHYLLKIFFTDRNAIEFKGTFGPAGGELAIDAAGDGLKLQGKIKDDESESRGDFTLSDTVNGFESARIFYRAYKGKIDVRTDSEKPLGAKAAQAVAAYKNGSFAWVHNWVVVNGPSFYLVDIVRTKSQVSTPLPLLEFKGKSKRTGDQVHEATPTKSEPRTEVKLLGNSEEDSRRLFAVSMKESATAEPDEFMLDVVWDQPNKPDEKEEPLNPPSAKDPSAYLKVDLETPRSHRMVVDFNKNKNLRGVRKFIREFQGNGRPDLQNFYTYANPFRSMIEKIGYGLDVSPAFAYLTVVESVYFTGGRYEIEGSNKSTALGPFQLLVGTGAEVGLRVSDGSAADERRYFAPSACGAAKYVRSKVDQFSGGDSTLAILAYYQGFAKAASFARAGKLSKKFSYSYSDLDDLAIIPSHMRAYVNKKLAVYFISSNMQQFGFSVPAKAASTLPSNGHVFPSAPINDVQCRRLMQDFIPGPSGS